jgi:hypothetical protein
MVARLPIRPEILKGCCRPEGILCLLGYCAQFLSLLAILTPYGRTARFGKTKQI